MGRVMAIDYGQKRVGLAITDPMKIIANGLTTVHSKDIFEYLTDYIAKEKVELFLVGYPLTLQNEPAQAVAFINPFIKKLAKTFPDIPIKQVDERFTSKMAFQAMIDGGLKKKQRQNKALIDTVSATIMLQSYLDQPQF